MITRRKLVVGSLAASGLLSTEVAAVRSASAQDSDPFAQFKSFGFLGPESDPEFGAEITGDAPQSTEAVGTGPSRHSEVAAAFRLLFDAKTSEGHLGVARYFESITKENRDGELYKWEWKTRANPLIVGLFSMTNTLPSAGDQTAWCAAFVNFCLYATRRKTTFSAMSGSFRRYGDPTSDPEPGDIVVFSKYGTKGKKGFGHVGFFVDRSGSTIKVLGGNQRPGTTGAVVQSDYKIKGKTLKLHSFRKVPSQQE